MNIHTFVPLIVGVIIVGLMAIFNFKKLESKKSGLIGAAISILLLFALSLIFKNPMINPIYSNVENSGVSFLGIILFSLSTGLITFGIELFSAKKK